MVAFIVFAFTFVFIAQAEAESIDSTQTIRAYRIDLEGREYLQEGYVEYQAWQDEFNNRLAQAEQLNTELLELESFLDNEDIAIVNDFNINNFKYIEEIDAYIVNAEQMKKEALAAKERQLEQQRRMNGSGLTRSGGVNWYNGRRETYYSSRVLYHYRTPEWWVDDEGFYRTSEGYYVVAASDMAQGTVFQGSKGLCQVLDSGCAAGTTDYYVSW